jgi:hypothetical protein
MSSKYAQYETPVAPTDLNAEYMDGRETAFVLKCSVRAVREALKALGRPGTPGLRVVTDRATRAAIYELRHGGAKSIRRTRSRTRKATVPQQATRQPARSAA